MINFEKSGNIDYAHNNCNDRKQKNVLEQKNILNKEEKNKLT